MKAVADLPVETLAAACARDAYGGVRDSLAGVTRRHGMIDLVDDQNEEAGPFVARAEADLTGELAVSAGSYGPGNLHLINRLFNYHRSRVGVLGIAAQIPSDEVGRGGSLTELARTNLWH